MWGEVFDENIVCSLSRPFEFGRRQPGLFLEKDCSDFHLAPPSLLCCVFSVELVGAMRPFFPHLLAFSAIRQSRLWNRSRPAALPAVTSIPSAGFSPDSSQVCHCYRPGGLAWPRMPPLVGASLLNLKLILSNDCVLPYSLPPSTLLLLVPVFFSLAPPYFLCFCCSLQFAFTYM